LKLVAWTVEDLNPRLQPPQGCALSN